MAENTLKGSAFKDRAKYTALERRGQNLILGAPPASIKDRLFPTGRQTPEQRWAFVESKLRGRTDELAERRREQFRKLAEKYAPNTPEELSNPNRTAGSGRPVDFVRKWYGPTSNNPTDDFPAELRKAAEYNEIKPRTYEYLGLDAGGNVGFSIPKKKSLFDVSYKNKRKRDAREARKPINRVLTETAYERLFDVVPMTRGRGGEHSVGQYTQQNYFKNKDGKNVVSLVGPRTPGGTYITGYSLGSNKETLREHKKGKTAIRNPEKYADELMERYPYTFGSKSGATRKEILDAVKEDADKYRVYGRVNSYGFGESMPGMEAQSPSEHAAGTMEHEYRHHYARPNQKTKEMIRGLTPQNQKPPSPAMHFFASGGGEFTQALGRLTAEFFQHTKKTTGKGRRIHERPEDLNRLIKGGEKEIEFLSPEGRRAVRALRNHIKSHPDKEADLMKEVRRVLPALVKNQPSKDVLKSGILRRMYA